MINAETLVGVIYKSRFRHQSALDYKDAKILISCLRHSSLSEIMEDTQAMTLDLPTTPYDFFFFGLTPYELNGGLFIHLRSH